MTDNLTNKGNLTNNLTNNAIEKALECCKNRGWFPCGDCHKNRANGVGACIGVTPDVLWEFIHRQKAEIEQWKAEAKKYQSLWASVCNEVKSDVVEVVRCKKCIHSTESPMRIICQKFWRDVNEDGYCNYGERKEE